MELTYNEAWIEFSRQLGLEFELIPTDEFGLTLDQSEVFVLRNFGAKNGMILFPNNTRALHISSVLTEKGYGYSVITAPRAGSSDEIEGMIEVLNEWEWTGRDNEQPDWLNRDT